ncbi:ankycorbin-like [Dreissena polymorpha]|uniref:Uncharacterized protein n=1 Tax=Dreissena polymorpha TaxID=45954 RepID=A0A9D4C1W7_DREPO|nr:ankycorbin-like [Dreissena polymorpha]XP_052247220.1 ankycorbin-like [Dreissena polymorpha]XP_052247221.1 ankycorbin-like [Dreissena polymorpha]XP_052247222.1 ankycorbin-like [Dreissena polymorpha]KAH3715660.1 hypothetical protein DPMN_058372 [Dreissena polymorpha]
MELITASKNGNFETAFNLLQAGVTPRVTDKDQATPLYWSACNGHNSLCEILIQAGSDVNKKVTWGSTPLHAAADRGHKDCVETLIQSGAEINCQNDRGDTALHKAAYRGHYDVIMTLLKARANVTIRNEKGKTPQGEALEGGHRDLAIKLSQFSNGVRNIPVDERDRRPEIGRLPLDLNRKSTPTRMCTGAPSEHESSEYENIQLQCQSPRIEIAPPIVLRQTSMDVLPPPRPPTTLGRSISFSGHHSRPPSSSRLPSEHAFLNPHMEVRANSVGNMNQLRPNDAGDAIRNYSSMEYVNANHLFDSELSSPTELSESSAYSSDTSWNTTSITSSPRNVPLNTCDQIVPQRDTPQMLHAPRQIRPNRSSLGSMMQFDSNCGIDVNSSVREFVAKLNKQLVESYKNNEQLTIENDSLKFKCSTLLNRLTETEQQLRDKQQELACLEELLEQQRQLRSRTEASAGTGSCEISETKSRERNGLLQFTEHIGKSMTEDALDEMQDVLRETLQNHALVCETEAPELDAPHREWLPGVDYVIVGSEALECRYIYKTDALPICLVFNIKHLNTGRPLRLKVLILRQRSSNVDSSYKTELDIVDQLGDNKHMETCLHSFEGPAQRFVKFIPHKFTKMLEAEQISPRSTFIVNEQLSSLVSFISSCEETFDGLLSLFTIQCFYKLFSVLCCLSETGIQHGSISEDSVFIDDCLNVKLGRFETASTSGCKQAKANGKRLPAESDEAFNDYENVPHIQRGSQTSHVSDDYSPDVSALCALFTTIFQRVQVSCTPASLAHAHTDRRLRVFAYRVVSDFTSWSAYRIMQSLGFLLLGDDVIKVNTEFACRAFVQTRMLRLLATTPPCVSPCNPDRQSKLRKAVERNRHEIEAHFLCNTSVKQILRLAQELR